MAGGIGGLASTLGKMAAATPPAGSGSNGVGPNTAGSANGGSGRGSRGLTAPSNGSMSAAQFGHLASQVSEGTSNVLSNKNDSGLPDLGDPAYDVPHDVPSGLYS